VLGAFDRGRTAGIYEFTNCAIQQFDKEGGSWSNLPRCAHGRRSTTLDHGSTSENGPWLRLRVGLGYRPLRGEESMRGICEWCGREKMLHFCKLGIHCNECEKVTPCTHEDVNPKLVEAMNDLRQAVLDLDTYGDDADLDHIGDVVMGAMSLINEVADERKDESAEASRK